MDAVRLYKIPRIIVQGYILQNCQGFDTSGQVVVDLHQVRLGHEVELDDVYERPCFTHALGMHSLRFGSVA